jgi:transcriptional regulator with XRE-family HTH domain
MQEESEPEANFFLMSVKPSEIWVRIQEAFGSQTAAEIARKLNIERQSVYKWRDGKNAPDLDRLYEISHVTGSSLHWLITGQGPKEIEPGQLQPAPTPAEQLLKEHSLPEVFNRLLEKIGEMEKDIATLKKEKTSLTLIEIADKFHTSFEVILQIRDGNTKSIDPQLVRDVQNALHNSTINGGEKTGTK